MSADKWPDPDELQEEGEKLYRKGRELERHAYRIGEALAKAGVKNVTAGPVYEAALDLEQIGIFLKRVARLRRAEQGAPGGPGA